MLITKKKYYPAFSTRESELRAYAELDENILDKIVPVVTLTRERGASSLQDSLDSILRIANGRPVILGFDPNPCEIKTDTQIAENRKKTAEKRSSQGKKPTIFTQKQEDRFQYQRDAANSFNNYLIEMKKSQEGFSNWRKFSLDAENIIPVIQISDISQIASQVIAIKEANRQMAFRIDVNSPASLAAFLIAAPHLDSAARAILILDAGHIRGSVDEAEQRVAHVLTSIRSNIAFFSDIVKVCMAGSFPGYLAELTSPLEIQERVLYDRVRAAEWDVFYGDYSAVQPRSAQAGGGGYYAHVEVAHARQWHFHRWTVKNEQKGFKECAQKLVADSTVWDGRCDSWGTNMVLRASQGHLDDGGNPPEKFGSAGKWVGPRVNQHITQQALHP